MKRIAIIAGLLSLLVALMIGVRIYVQDPDAPAVASTDTLAGVTFYLEQNPEMYVHILADSEMDTRGFTDYSAALLQSGSTTHEEPLYLFLPYTESSGAWCLSIDEDTELRIDGTAYHNGDRVTGLADEGTYEVGIYDTESGEARECGSMTVRYNGDVPVLFAEAQDLDVYDDIRSRKFIDADVNWFCLDASGELDSSGEAVMSGHGNSTYTHGNKKPLNLRLNTAQSILGIGAVKKYVLLSNSMDPSNIKDRIVYEAARRLGMAYTPECTPVICYVNGEYEGLYLLSQKVDVTRGCVQGEHDLDQDAKELNGGSYPDSRDAVGGRDSGYVYGYNKAARTPENYTGTYLMELMGLGFRSKHIDEPSYTTEHYGQWFVTDVLEMLIRSPRYPSETEVLYIRDLVLDAERALYAEDGVNPETGKSYDEYYDVESWGQLILLQDFFSLQDYSMGSIFVLKRQDDDLLYVGPIWDYDKSMTDDYYNRYVWTFPSDEKARLVYWMYQISTKEEIRDEMRSQYVNQLSDIMREMNEVDIPQWIHEIASAAAIDNLRWGCDAGDAATWAERVQTWCAERTAYYDSVWVSGELDEADSNVWPREYDPVADEIK